MDEVELQECVDEAPREIRRTWVDSPDPSYFSSHRNLAKCARDLKYMKSAMRDYAYSDEKTDPHVIKRRNLFLPYLECKTSSLNTTRISTKS